MNSNKLAYFQIHAAVILWGFAAILGDVITLSALSLVWWRVGIAALGLAFLTGTLRSVRDLAHRQLLIFIGIGILLGLHWLTFYGSVKLANASIALVTFCSISLFTSLLEPLINKSRFEKLDVLFGLLIVPALAMVGGEIDIDSILGFWIGLLSALLMGLVSILNKKYIQTSDSKAITFIEMVGAFISLGIILTIMTVIGQGPMIQPQGYDWMFLPLLAFGCTIIPFILYLASLKHISAFTSSFVASLEPVYGVILAIVILNDHKDLTPRFYLGVIIIFILIFTHPIISARLNKK